MKKCSGIENDGEAYLQCYTFQFYRSHYFLIKSKVFSDESQTTGVEKLVNLLSPVSNQAIR